MKYEKNYARQVFCDSNQGLSIGDVFSKVKENMIGGTVPMPPSPTVKVFLTSGVIAILAGIIGGIISFLITKSGVFALVIGMGLFGIGLGVLFIAVSTFTFGIYAKKCTYPITATCIGYSVTGGGNNNSPGHAVLYSPVFQYTYRENEYTSFNEVYSNVRRSMPRVGDKFQIMIDSADPWHINWADNKKTMIFFIFGGIVSIFLGAAFLWLTQVDEDFRNQTLNNNQTTVSSEPIVEKSKDGRIILTDDYISTAVDAEGVGKDWVIGIRELEEVITEEDSEDYKDKWGFLFIEDTTYQHDGVNVKLENLTDAMKNNKPGDLYYYVETADGATIFSCDEYVYSGSKEVKK